MKSRGNSNSIFILAVRTFPFLRFNWINFLIPLFIGTLCTVLAAFYLDGPNVVQQIGVLSSTLLAFNGAALGFVIAGFAIFASPPDSELVVFSATNAPEGGRFSFLKNRLLIFVKTFFWVFLGTVAIAIIHVCSSLYPSLNETAKAALLGHKALLIALAIFVTSWAQAKIFVELKIFIFTVYNSALTQARFMVQKNGAEPFDKIND